MIGKFNRSRRALTILITSIAAIIFLIAFNRSANLAKKHQDKLLEFEKTTDAIFNDDNDRTMQWQFHNQTLTHVVLKFYPGQKDMVKNNLLRWNTYYPCLKGEIHPFLKFDKPSVVFYASFKSTIPEKERDELENEMLEFYDTLSENVKQCFGDPLFKSIEIKPQDDTHVTGARLLVEALFDVEKPLLPDAQYILIMEHDLRAIRKNWLGKLILETAWPQLMFWIKGSIYRGKLSLVEGTTYIPNLYHINGGCIYNVGDVEFREFYRSVRSYIVKKHGDSPNAYDTDFFEWSIDVANYDKFRHVAHMFRYTDVIQNQWISPYYIPDINRKNPNTHLIHGGNIQSNPL